MLMMLKMHCDDVMLRMYMGGVVTLLDIPGGGNIVVKGFKYLWRGMT